MLILLVEIGGKANSQFRVAIVTCDEKLRGTRDNSNPTRGKGSCDQTARNNDETGIGALIRRRIARTERQFKFSEVAVKEPSAVAPDPKRNLVLRGFIGIDTRIDSKIRRYRARFCKQPRSFQPDLTHGITCNFC